MEEIDQGSFEKTVDEILKYAFQYGIDQLGEVDPTSASKEEMTRFIELCHEGYVLAQERLLEELLQIEETKIKLSRLQKSARRNHNTDVANTIKEMLVSVNYGEQVLRSIGNSLVWTMFGLRQWEIRRLYQGVRPPSLRESNIESVISIARGINKERRKFALVTDLTSCAQMGDLIINDLSGESQRLAN